MYLKFESDAIGVPRMSRRMMRYDLLHSRHRSRLARCGLTLVEIIVVIVIIGILLAITIPAVQYARESARRSQCKNNQRQIVLAAHAFHTAHGSLPSLYNGTSLSYPLQEWDLFHTHSWRVPLLPHLEQAALRDGIAWDSLATEPENEFVAQSVVSVYVCPTGADPLQTMGWGLTHASLGVPAPTAGNKYHVTRSDYDAMAGIVVLPDPMPTGASSFETKFVRWGVWGWPNFDNGLTSGSHLHRYRAGKFRDITDGLSNTMAVVERAGKPIDLLNGKPNVTAGNPNAYYPGQVGWSASNSFAWALNGSRVGVNESNSLGIYSLHSGGANVAMADGSVRFLSDTISNNTLIAMFSRSGGPEG